MNNLPVATRGPLALFLLTAALVTSLAGCSDEKSPEEQVRATLSAGVKALEDKDVGAAGALLAEGYRDSRGRDRKRMKALAFVVLRRGPVLLSLSDQQIEIDPSGQRAKASVKVTALQTEGAPETVGDLVPRGRALDVEIDLVREGDEWRIAAIEGDGMGGGSLE